MAVKFEKVRDGTYMLDVKGYVCPHPQLYTKKAMEKLKPGDILQLLFDNPSSGESILAMCQTDGNEIVEQTQQAGNAIRWHIRKG